MKTYKVMKTVNGQQPYAIREWWTIEEARQDLCDELEAAIKYDDDMQYFPTTREAQAELEFAEDSREDWGDERVNKYIEGLKEGIESGKPFVASSVTGECVTIEDDCFWYDNYKLEIEEINRIDTMQDLAEYIEDTEEDTDFGYVDEIIERNGWKKIWGKAGNSRYYCTDWEYVLWFDDAEAGLHDFEGNEFEFGTQYPLYTCDSNYHNASVDYCDGEELQFLEELCRFDKSEDEEFKAMVLANAKAEDIEAIKSGYVYTNSSRTMKAVLYGE